MKELGSLTFILAWVFEFFMLGRFFLFMVAFFFEKLARSGTDKMIGFRPVMELVCNVVSLRFSKT